MKIFISAGEPSGDLYGAILVQELKRRVPGIELEGIGGKLMAEAGVHLVKSIDELAIFGFYEGVKSYPKVKKVLQEAVSHLRQNPPDVLLPIAFSNFNLLLLKEYQTIRPSDYQTIRPLRTIYYAPPQLWAWGRWRGRLLKKYADAVICLFPFEEDFFKNMGINAVYLGNPLLDYVKSRQSKSAFLKTWSLNPDPCILSLMPGSRTDEVRHHLPLMLKIFSGLKNDLPNLYGFVILSENIEFPDLPQTDRLLYTRNRKYDIMKNSDLILLTSGTAALESLILETPAVSIYTLSPLSYRIARFAVKLKGFSIPNLIADKKIMPELVQPDFNTLYPMVFDLLMNQSMRQEVKKDFIEAKYRLGPPGAQKRIVKKILE